MKEPSPCSVGSYVNKGDVVGNINNTGFSTGSHLHFEIAKQSRVSVAEDGQIKIRTIEIRDKKTGDVVGIRGRGLEMPLGRRDRSFQEM